MEFLQHTYPILYQAVLITGLVYCLIILIQFSYWLIKSIYIFYISSPINLHKAGEWAIITGCTDGIGKAYTEKFASCGLNIVLMSRTQDKLEAQAKELERTYKIYTKIIQIDFSTASKDVYASIAQQLNELDIGILVNNVGMALAYALYFCDPDNSTEDISTMLKVNCQSLLKMTHIILPGMLSRKRGVIINIASGAGVMHIPLQSIYSPTKAFVRKFSHSLQYEYKSTNIIIQTVAPYMVCTKMTKFKKSRVFMPNPIEFVNQSIRSVGRDSDTHGYFSHEVLGGFRKLLPECVDQWVLFSYLKWRLEYGKRKRLE